ncbi:MAG: hypothetical protein C1943_07765 [Halochromatium sp.]|nr:hypothetical protein [Halochromatium sp.]
MFIFGKKKKILIAFAAQTADTLFSQAPPALVEKHRLEKSKQATKQFHASVEDALMRVAQFKASEKPGIYGKAKLHLVFANRLKELGYPDEVANEINAYILTKTP